MIEQQFSVYETYRGKRQWRYGKLVREIKRGRHKGLWIFEVFHASKGTKQLTVARDKVICTCCGLSCAGAELKQTPAGIVLVRKGDQ